VEGTCHFWRVDGSNGCGEGQWSQIFGFETERFQRPFWDDMQSGNGQWSHMAGLGTDGWVLTSTRSYSPDYAWFSPGVSTVNDDYLWNTHAFSAMSDAELSFWQRYDLESGSIIGWDGAVIEISTDGGRTWQDLEPYIIQNPYNSTISSNYGSPIAGRRAWSGTSGGWQQVKVDLAAFAGQQAQVRWRLACDSAFHLEGWYVDDVEVSATLPANDFRYGACLSVDTSSPFTATVAGVYSYTWDFGGAGSGAYLDTATPIFTYTVPGDYVVEMGLDNACVADSISHTVSVCGPYVQATGIDASPDPRSQEVVTLTALAAGVEPIAYTWDFADGTSADGVTTTHTFPVGGNQPVTLTVSNCDGCGADQLTQTVPICDSVGSVVVDASPGTPRLGETVTFTATANGDQPRAYAWDFGDGSPPLIGGGFSATHTYTRTGEYTTTLVVTNCVDAVVGIRQPVTVVLYQAYLPLIVKP
jgi:PKD repeat protein